MDFSSQKSFVFLGLLLIVLYYIFFTENCCKNTQFWEFTELSKQSTKILLCILKAQKCLLKNEIFNSNLTAMWPQLPYIVQSCSNPFIETINITSLPNNDEEKHFILPRNLSTDSCNIITLGIGGDVTSELKIAKLLPQCKFLGIDNGSKNSKKYYEENLGGTFVQGLVGVKNGTFQATILGDNGKYTGKTLTHFSFQYFVQKYFNKNLIIDMLFMDIESAEFGLMSDLIDQPELYPIICQLNVEFHDPYAVKYNVTQMLQTMTSEGPYLLVKVDNAHPYMRAFLVNVYERICIEKYLLTN